MWIIKRSVHHYAKPPAPPMAPGMCLAPSRMSITFISETLDPLSLVDPATAAAPQCCSTIDWHIFKHHNLISAQKQSSKIKIQSPCSILSV